MQIQFPENAEDEALCLGSLFHNRDAQETACATLTSEDFFHSPHKEIFKVITQINISGAPLTEEFAIQLLRKNNALEAVGGPFRLVEIIQKGFGSDSNYYINKVKELSHRRNAAALCLNAATDFSDVKKEYQQVYDPFCKKISNLCGTEFKTFKTLKDIIKNFKNGKSFLQYLEEKRYLFNQGEDTFAGIKSGYSMLDNLIGGFGNGQNIIIGARSGTGKTTFLVNLIRNIVKNYPQKRIAFFSLEMSKEKIFEKFACSLAGVDPRKFYNYDLTNEEAQRFVEACKMMGEWKVLFYPYSTVNINNFVNSVRKEFRNDGIDIVFTDYLTRVRSVKKQVNKHLEIDEISKGLQDIALELNIPFVTLAQLNRNIFNRTDKRPVVADLRESGSIEEDSDVILLMHRPKHYDDHVDDVLELFVAKNRHLGALGCIKFSFDYGIYNEISASDDMPKPEVKDPKNKYGY